MIITQSQSQHCNNSFILPLFYYTNNTIMSLPGFDFESVKLSSDNILTSQIKAKFNNGTYVCYCTEGMAGYKLFINDNDVDDDKSFAQS